MTTNTGGPAFPTQYFYDQETKQEIIPSIGMTLRDYFAAAYLANQYCACTKVEGTAIRAYEVADAMLKAREA